MRLSYRFSVYLVLAPLVSACSSAPLEADLQQNGTAELEPAATPYSVKQASPSVDPSVLPGSPIVFGRPCADGTVEQTFMNGLVGCAGRVTWDNRGGLCGAGYRPATAREWTGNRGSVAPGHNYWTDDPLAYQGSAASCSVDRYAGSSCGAEPMRVCTANGADPEGNACNWKNCGYQSSTQNDYFGGCAGNSTAGALCVPDTCAGAVAAGSCRKLFADYIQWVQNGNYVAIEGSSLQAQDSGRALVSYVAGSLFTPSVSPGAPRAISGSFVTQLFSDRLAGSQPFDIAARDQLSIELDEDGRVHIALDSWGHGRITVEPVSCANDIAYGFSDDGALWGFVLAKRYTPG